jgi:glycerol-3-phosphate acyltransferase PlsY
VIVAPFILIVVIGYLLGAIPSGVIVGKVARGIDVRKYGSGSMGSTNVLRTVGKKAGLIVLFADVLKGAAAVALAWPLFHWFDAAPGMVEWGRMAGGVAAVIGHSWPVYVGFRGGRSINVAFGAIMAMSWYTGLILVPVFFISVAVTRYISLSSILTALALIIATIPFVIWGGEPFAYLVFALVAVPIVLFRHRGNIKRLISRTEPKIGQKAKTT